MVGWTAGESNAFCEKRQYDRSKCNLKVSCQVISTYGYACEEAHAVDISKAGACVFGTKEIKTPALLEVSVDLPKFPFKHLMLAKILHCDEINEYGVFEMRLKFIGFLPNGLQDLITRSTPKVKSSSANLKDDITPSEDVFVDASAYHKMSYLFSN